MNAQPKSMSPSGPGSITSEPTVGEYLEEWLWGKQALRPSTHASYEVHVRRYLNPHLGQLSLSALQTGHIQRMYRHLSERPGRGGKPLSIATIRRIHATLMSAFNTAVRRGLLERNPAATVELPRARKPAMSAWTQEELGRFLRHTQTDRMHPLFLILALVGLRRGEVVALRWSDLDLNQGLIRVE